MAAHTSGNGSSKTSARPRAFTGCAQAAFSRGCTWCLTSASNSFGAFMTICRIVRNDAEKRIRKMGAAGWGIGTKGPVVPPGPDDDDSSEQVDLEQLARDAIAKLISQKFTGRGLTRLVDAVLRAQGYVTYVSPEGPDKGIDILAAKGPLGFGDPRLCVQVKSGETPTDSPTLNQLIGSMQNVHAEQGLLVSWAGFKSTVDK